MLLLMSKASDVAGRWREVLRRQARSGLSVAAFCRRFRISQASFYAWRRKLRDAGTFAEVRLAPDAVLSAGAMELVLAGGRRIVVRPGFDRTTLLALVDALERGAPQGGIADEGLLRSSRPDARRESGA
jgi:hypothetical protein